MKKTMKKTGAVLMLLFTLLIPAVSAQADAVFGSTGSLKFRYEYHDEELSVPVQGAEISITKIADVAQGTQYPLDFTTAEGFRAANFTIPYDMTAAESGELAERLAKYRAQNGLSADQTVTVGSDGIADFGSVPVGVYLVEQTGKTGEAEKYDSFSPMLTILPMYEDGSYTTDVVIEPKTAVTRQETSVPSKPETPKKGGSKGSSHSSSVKTEDSSQIFVWIGLMMITLGVMVVITAGVYRRRQK